MDDLLWGVPGSQVPGWLQVPPLLGVNILAPALHRPHPLLQALLCIVAATVHAMPHFDRLSCLERLKSKGSVYQEQVPVGRAPDYKQGVLVVVPGLPPGELCDLGPAAGHPCVFTFFLVNEGVDLSGGCGFLWSTSCVPL